MSLVLSLSSLALRQLVDGACTAVGVPEGGTTALAVAVFLKERFTDHSQRLNAALHGANDRAWKALELALVGDSLLERCKAATARTEDKTFARQVRAFLDATPLLERADKTEFRPKCLAELRTARKAGLLTAGDLPPAALAEQTGAFARFGDPQSLLDGEWRVVQGMAQTLKEAGFVHLALLLAQRPPQGPSLLVIGARYFFRRAVEEDPKLAHGLAFAQMERLSKTQEEGFASLAAAMTQQGQRLEELFGDVRAVVVETHSAVLDLQGQIEGQSEHIQQIGAAVQKLLEQHQLQRREVRPGDSLSIRNDNERQLVKQLVARYRALPEEERRQVPALLNGIGKLEVVAGDFDAARKDFAAVATLVEDNTVQAEAHFNAYQVCLERRDWSAAISEFVKAVKLDGKRFASFPVGKYQPQRILGAGGFGVAFLCKHKYMDAQVVVKTLMLEDLGREADKVFSEAQLLRQLDHPAIIRIADCGYVDSGSKSRPYLVMDYFAGGTLEEHVKKHGVLSVDDLLAVARPVAEGLQAAHGKGILHRDVKPANLLIRKEGASWQVKVIDFGLALRQKVVRTSMNASTSRQTKTLLGESMAGTLDYAAPEQMGKRNDPAGPYSDVYGWAKTCCYALFQTTQPLLKHWQSIPQGLAELLEKCLDEDPKQRPSGFGEVLKWLGSRRSKDVPSAPPPIVPHQTFDFESPEKEVVDAPAVASTRKKSKKSVVPWILGGVGLFVVALVVLFAFILGVQKQDGTGLVKVDPLYTTPQKDRAPKKIPALEKRFHAKSEYNSKTNKLTLSYDFSSKEQLADFDLMGAKPTIKAGLLRVAPADVLRHVAKFKSVEVTGQFVIENFSKRNGSGEFIPFLRLTEGVSAGTGDWNGLRVAVHWKERSLGIKTFAFGAPVENVSVPVVLDVSETRARLKFKEDELAGVIDSSLAGQVELSGGLGGVQIRSLVISGIPDEEWAKEFLKEPESTRNSTVATESDNDLAQVITPAALKKLAGKTAFDSKTKELTLVYDFKTDEQLKDFDLKEAKPNVKTGVVQVGASDVFRHVANFKTVKVTGQFAVENFSKRDGSGQFTPFLQTTAGVAVGTGDRNGLWVALNSKGKALGIKTFPFGAPIENTFVSVVFSISERKAALKFTDAELGGLLEPDTAGQVELLGGLGGLRIHSLVISGVPDKEWARAFFKD